MVCLAHGAASLQFNNELAVVLLNSPTVLLNSPTTVLLDHMVNR